MSKRKKPRVSRMWRGVKAAQPGDPMKRMMNGHEDVLQNIEFVLVTAYRADDEVDDHVAAEALRAAIGGLSPLDQRVARLVRQLAAMREERADIEDKTWRDALSVVLHSARRHSDCRAGSTYYLDFAAQFLP